MSMILPTLSPTVMEIQTATSLYSRISKRKLLRLIYLECHIRSATWYSPDITWTHPGEWCPASTSCSGSSTSVDVVATVLLIVILAFSRQRSDSDEKLRFKICWNLETALKNNETLESRDITIRYYRKYVNNNIINNTVDNNNNVVEH